MSRFKRLGILFVENDHVRRVLINLGFCPPVAIKVTVPVEVVFGYVQKGGDIERNLSQVVKLEAGKLYNKVVKTHRIPYGIENWHSDIAAGNCRFSGLQKHCLSHFTRGCLTVGAGHADPLGDFVVLVPKPPRQFDVANNKDSLFLELPD